MYWLWEGRLLGASMVLVLWVWSLLFGHITGLLAKSIVKPKKMSVATLCKYGISGAFMVLCW
jgi:uncharacterized membrane protein YeaQ/YmgE (transglycosylase-associated protein family)